MPVVTGVAASGIRQVQSDLKWIRRRAYRVSSVRSTRTVVREARKLAPVASGKLRKYIRSAGAGKVVADPFTFPSERAKRKPGPPKRPIGSYASMVHYGGAAGGQGRGRQKANPFFDKAVRNKRQEIADHLDDALQDVIDQQIRYRQRALVGVGAAAAIRRRR